MNERAAVCDGTLPPIWHLDAATTFFAGPLFYNASHQHGAAVYLAGLYGPFGLRLRGTKWICCRTALVPAGLLHELDLGGQPIAVLYLESHRGGASGLRALVRSDEEVDGALVGRAGEITALRELYECADSLGWAGGALADLTGFSRSRAGRESDGRIGRAVSLLAEHGDRAPRLADLAVATGLSSSRFQHLFTREVGVPFRRYRAWARMRRAIAEIVAGANFTTAAHATGFADQPHFARDFRRTFGAPATVSLTAVRKQHT